MITNIIFIPKNNNVVLEDPIISRPIPVNKKTIINILNRDNNTLDVIWGIALAMNTYKIQHNKGKILNRYYNFVKIKYNTNLIYSINNFYSKKVIGKDKKFIMRIDNNILIFDLVQHEYAPSEYTMREDNIITYNFLTEYFAEKNDIFYRISVMINNYPFNEYRHWNCPVYNVAEQIYLDEDAYKLSNWALGIKIYDPDPNNTSEIAYIILTPKENNVIIQNYLPSTANDLLGGAARQAAEKIAERVVLGGELTI